MKHKKIQRITLFWPVDPTISDSYPCTPSLGMQYLAKILRRNGYEVVVIDCDMILFRSEVHSFSDETIDKLIRVIEKTNPDILGVGSYTVTMPIVAELTRKFKARNPSIPIILGGVNPSLLADETLGFLPYIDFLVRGEGEHTLLELIKTIKLGRPLNKVRGISYIKKDKIVHTPERSFIRDLGTLPIIDIEEFLIKKNKKFMFSTMFDRGCIGQCSYCEVRAMWGIARFFPPNHIVKQIKHLRELYPEVGFIFNTDNLFSNLQWLKKTANLIHKEIPKYVFLHL